MYDNIKRAVIEINADCFMGCRMCPSSMGRGEFSGSIELSEYKRLVDELIPLGVEVIQLDGSGEPTMLRNLPEYIEYANKKGLRTQISSNGQLMQANYMKRCVDAGLDLFRFSVIGWSCETYQKLMGRRMFNHVRENAVKMREYIDSSGSDCVLASYHLAFTVNEEGSGYEMYEQDIQMYQSEFINIVNSSAEIWEPHNWSGWKTTKRSGIIRTCGRPFAPEITIRAGGINGHRLAVTPCCQTLGRDEIAVLGHLDTDSILDVYNSERYNWLRKMHEQEAFDDIEICKNCDFLYDDPAVLVWTNKETGNYRQMNGMDFKL